MAGGQSGSKEDKTRPSKERRVCSCLALCEIYFYYASAKLSLMNNELQPSSSRGSSLRDEGKAIGKESAAVDPPGLQEQVCIEFFSS